MQLATTTSHGQNDESEGKSCLQPPQRSACALLFFAEHARSLLSMLFYPDNRNSLTKGRHALAGLICETLMSRPGTHTPW